MTVESDQLIFLVYISEAAVQFDKSELKSLLLEARRFNSANELTGMLLFKDSRFMQVLEGKRQIVQSLFTDICKDSRHTNIDMIIEEPAAKRFFADWTMGYCDLLEPEAEVLDGYSSFLRYGIRANNAPVVPSIPYTFLTVFSDNKPILGHLDNPVH